MYKLIYTSSYIFFVRIQLVEYYMRISNKLLISTSMAITLVMASSLAILFADNLTTTANAQEEQQLSNQTASIGNGTLFESTMDKFRVQLPEGWIVHDINNTGPTLESEVL